MILSTLSTLSVHLSVPCHFAYKLQTYKTSRTADTGTSLTQLIAADSCHRSHFRPDRQVTLKSTQSQLISFTSAHTLALPAHTSGSICQVIPPVSTARSHIMHDQPAHTSGHLPGHTSSSNCRVTQTARTASSHLRPMRQVTLPAHECQWSYSRCCSLRLSSWFRNAHASSGSPKN